MLRASVVVNGENGDGSGEDGGGVMEMVVVVVVVDTVEVVG